MENDEIDLLIEELYQEGRMIIDRFAVIADRYCKDFCMAEGLTQILRQYYFGNQDDTDRYIEGFGYDYRNFAFAKSIKSLYGSNGVRPHEHSRRIIYRVQIRLSCILCAASYSVQVVEG